MAYLIWPPKHGKKLTPKEASALDFVLDSLPELTPVTLIKIQRVVHFVVTIYEHSLFWPLQSLHLSLYM